MATTSTFKTKFLIGARYTGASEVAKASALRIAVASALNVCSCFSVIGIMLRWLTCSIGQSHYSNQQRTYTPSETRSEVAFGCEQ
jgi:hypothetical protein